MQWRQAAARGWKAGTAAVLLGGVLAHGPAPVTAQEQSPRAASARTGIAVEAERVAVPAPAAAVESAAPVVVEAAPVAVEPAAAPADATAGERFEVTIANLATFKVAGEAEPRLIARVEGPLEQSVRIDLGPRARLAPLNLRAGDALVVYARRTTLEGRPVLRALRVEANGQVVSLVGPPRPVRTGPQKVVGRIMNVDTVRLPGDTHRSVLAIVQVENESEPRTTLLGPMRAINVLELRKGDPILMVARVGQLNGRAVLVADELVINGKPNRVRATPPAAPTADAERAAAEAERR